MSDLGHGPQGFNWRAYTSMMTTGGFVVMSVTGVMLFTIPEGRVANWVDWSMVGLTKGQWGDIHLTSSLFFIVIGLLHLWYNWRQFMAYLRSRFQQRVKIRPEGPAAAAFMAVLVACTLYEVPPFTYVLDLSSAIKASWSVDPAMEPPFGHAEEVTLKTLALRTATTPAEIIGALRDAGWTVVGEQQTVRQVADANSTSPAELWVDVQTAIPAVRPEAIDATAAWTPEAVEARFEGMGYGGKYVSEAAKDLGLPEETVLGKLAAVDPSASASDKLKDVAERAKTTPTELLKLILVKDYQLPKAE
ncbi:DUF4405 domain-containing protein [Oryzibacter oryziterrae]|uniref:DUF4405 domain-containing protein n=1 Tax=Oryzibacter oryziterrae TaxID=2766474 RepID=UPI001F284947|nr:DUF4405 domain-containing protein [Oryzibacter oryziterrae]